MKWLDKFVKNKDKGGILGFWNILIILFFGVILLVFSNTYITGKKQTVPKPINENTKITLNEDNTYEEKLESRLEKKLSLIDGVGQVKVLLTIDSTKELVIDKEQPCKESTTEENDAEGGTRHTYDKDCEDKTVLTNEANGVTKPIILKENMPEVKGIVIMAEGGDKPIIKEQLSKAASILLDLPINKIQICKMK